MLRNGTTTQNCRLHIRSAANRLAKRSTTVVMISLVAYGLLAMITRTRSVKSSASSASITVRAAGRGKPYFNFQDGRELRVDYRGDRNLTEALRAGQAQPRSLASIVLAGDAVPDLIAGYSWNGMGVVTVQHGNPDAFAPKDESVFVRMQQGYNPDSLLPAADAYQVPEGVDFLQVGDFNHDNRKDALVAARGGDLFLLAGDGRGRLEAPEQISLPGRVTAMTAGEFRAADGWTDVAVAVDGPSGPALLIYDGVDGLQGTPMSVPLSAPATAVQIAALDNDSFTDVAVAAGSEIDIIHGWGRKQSANLQSRVQRINLSSSARDMATGFFIWNRAGSNQIAVLSDDGTVKILAQAGADARPFSAEEIALFWRGRANAKRQPVDVESLSSWQPNDSAAWTTARELSANSSLAADAVSQSVLLRSHISFHETDDLLLLDGNRHKLDIVRQIDAKAGVQTEALPGTNDLTTVSLDLVEAPAAVLALPQKLNGERNLVLLQKESAFPILVPLAANFYVVDFGTPFADCNDSATHGGAGTMLNPFHMACLRGAVTAANANAGSTITLPAGTYTLTINGTQVNGRGCESNTAGDLGIDASTTITGAGSATTIIRQHGTGPAGQGDRVMCLNETIAASRVYNFSGITITGGRDSTDFGGAGIIGGGHLNSLTLTDVVVSNNQATGVGDVNGGGGIQIAGGDVNITNSTIGGTTVPGLSTDRDSVANANKEASSGGGLSFDPSSANFNGEVSNLTVTGTTFNHNTANSGSAGGGGVDLLVLTFNSTNTGTGTAKFNTCTFSNNQATGGGSGGSGGAMIVETLPTTVGTGAGTTSFDTNSAANRGGGIYVGGSTLLLDATSATITFSGNTAVTPNTSSISTAGATTAKGTNLTIGGDLEVTTNGSWTNTNGVGTSISPTNVVIGGGTWTSNDSTTNVGGNFVFSSGTFNSNTGTFNFNGSGAQSINGPSSPTFNNLTVNKGGGTLTLAVNTPVVSNLTVTAGTFDLAGFTANRTAAGGTLTVSNGTSLKIGGTNTLPSNFSTHAIGATSTIEYEGTTQTVATLNSSQNYGNLIISGSGTKTLQGGITVASDLTINGGTLDASASNFNINSSGNWINNVAAANFNPRAATVTFNSTSAGQSIKGTASSQTFNNVTVNKSSQTLSVASSTTTLTLNGAMTLSAGVFDSGTATAINVGGNWTNDVGATAFTPGSGTVTFNSTTAGQTIGGNASSQTFNNLTVSKSGQTLNTGGSTTQLDLNNAFSLNAGSFTAPATLNVAGNWSEATGTTFTPGSGTVTFNSSGAVTLGGTATSQTFNNLIANKTSGGSVTGVSSTTGLTINGGVTLTAGTFDAGSITAIGIAGDWTNNGGTFTPGSSVVTFNSTTAAQTIKGSAAIQTFGGITVNKSGQTMNVSGNTTILNLNGNMNITAGSFLPNTAASINVGGDWTVASAATFTAGSGSNTVTFNSTGAKNINGTAGTQTFNNLVINKTSGGSITVGGSTTTLTINKDLTITAGTLDAGTAATINESGGNWSNSGTFTPGSGTVFFNANAVAQTLSGSTTFNNLTINHTGAGNVSASGSTLVVTGSLHVVSGTFISSSTFNNVQIDSGQTLQSDGNTMNVSGNWTNDGGTFTPNGNTVNFNGSGVQSISGLATTQSFNNFTVNKSGGTLSVAASTTTLTIGGTLTLTASLFSAGTATTINVAGGWTNSGGTFTAGAGTVVFNGSSLQTIGGSSVTTFNNLTIANAGTGVSLTQNETVNGTLTLTNDLTTGANTLTQPSTAPASAGTGDVIGLVKRTGGPFLTGVALTFGNPFNSLLFAVAGTTPTDVTFKLTKTVPTPASTGFANSAFPIAVARTYIITPNGGTGYSATVRLHYQNTVAELNGNAPAGMNLWRFDSSINGWRPNPATARDCASGCDTNLSNFWAERSGVTTFSPWALNSTLSPTAETGTVSGRITDDNGGPVAGAVVRLAGNQGRKTISDANGNYHFDNVQTNGFYTVTPSRVNYNFNPTNRSFSQIGSNTEAAFTATSTGDSANPLDTPEYFVRQQYVDILGREPDEGGFNYWSDQILACNGDADCARARRTGVAGAFFIEQEFQLTGSFIYDVYQGALGRRPAFVEYSSDRQQVVGGATLESEKAAFVQGFVQRAEFAAKYQANTTAESFVDALIQNVQSSGVNLSDERANLISTYNSASNTVESRAIVVRTIADNATFKQAQYNPAFVLTEYFGYLRRNPEQGGFDFWLNVLNNGDRGNYSGMVCSFVTSAEYQKRFSSVVSHSNSECGP